MEEATVTILDPANGWDMGKSEILAGRLAGFAGPAYKRAYLQGLLRSGLKLLEAGNGRTAAYCLDKVEGALEEAAALATAAAAAASQSTDEGPDAFDSEDASDEGTTAVSGPRAGRAARARGPRKARDSRPPLERLRAEWREDRLRKAEAILAKHGPRLTSLERKAYLESLAKWNQAVRDAAGSPAASSAARRADHALLDLRRRLYGRILKSQKAHLVRRGGTGSLALVQVHEQFPGPIGPYNDRQNLEGVLTLLSQADPAWVEEFLELYSGLDRLKAMIPSTRG